MPEIAQGIAPEQEAAIQRALDRKKGVKPTGAKGKLPDPKKFGANSLDKNSFLKLLVTQLQKQDPTNPMNDKEFISQMAQFSSLEQMNNVANSMNRMRASQATHFIGKMVLGKDIESEQPLQGIVVGARYQPDGEVLLQIGNGFSRMDDIKQVTQVTPIEQPVQMPVTSPQNQNVSRETIPTATAAPRPGQAIPGAQVIPVAPQVNPAQAAQAYEANQKPAGTPPHPVPRDSGVPTTQKNKVEDSKGE